MTFWTDEDIKILKKKYRRYGSKIPELKKAGFTKCAIICKANYLNLHHKDYKASAKNREKKLDLPDDEIISDYDNGMTMNKLSRKYHCTISSIRRRLVENNIPIRDRRISICSSRNFLHHISVSDYLLQVLDGLLLGDGSYVSRIENNETGYFSVEQSTDHQQWIEKIEELFKKHGIKYGLYFRTRKPVKKICQLVTLQSSSCIEFGDQYRRWYPKGKKRVPSDINLTPVVLAHWYMGDGSLSSSSYKKYNRAYYTLRLCTDGLPKENVEFLQKQLIDKYNYQFLVKKEKNAWRLKINHRDTIRDFLYKTSMEKVDCFNYKWKPLFDQSHVIGRKYWTAEEDEYIIKYYEEHGSNITYLRNRGRTKSSIKQRANKLGKKKTLL